MDDRTPEAYAAMSALLDELGAEFRAEPWWRTFIAFPQPLDDKIMALWFLQRSKRPINS